MTINHYHAAPKEQPTKGMSGRQETRAKQPAFEIPGRQVSKQQKRDLRLRKVAESGSVFVSAREEWKGRKQGVWKGGGGQRIKTGTVVYLCTCLR